MALVTSLATYKPLGKQTEAAMTAHDIVCVHTMVGYLKSTGEMFGKNGYGGTESHFGVGGIWGVDKAAQLDGDIWQWQDLRYQADANLEGNHRVISIETADNAPSNADDIVLWTPNQVVSLVRLIRQLCSKEFHKNCPSSWKCHQVGIPMTLIPDTKPGRRGLAYHRQGVKHSSGYGVGDYLVKGGEQWSTATGKQCPGKNRINQFKTVVIPALPEKVTTKPATPIVSEEDDEMKLRTYAGKYYLFWGFFRREIAAAQVAEATKLWGPATAASLLEMSVHTPFDTLTKIWGDDRIDSADAEAAAKAALVTLKAQGEQLGRVEELLKTAAEPPVAPTS